SRRRHTRSDRDWSSDVCSSDLVGDVGRRGLVRDALELAAGLGDAALGDEQPGEIQAQDGEVGIGFDALPEMLLRLLAVAAEHPEIGRASCRERVEISLYVVLLI